MAHIPKTSDFLDVDRWAAHLPPGAFDPARLLRQEVVIEPDTGKPRQAGASQAEGAFIEELKRDAEASLYVFGKGILGLTRLTDHLHRGVCDWLQRVPPYRKLYLLPRDFLKTSIARSLVLHLIIQPREKNRYFPGCWEDGCGLDDCQNQKHFFEGRNVRILYAGEVEGNATKQLGWTRAKLDNCDLLRALWPHCTWQESKREAARWNNKSYEVPRTKNVDYPEGTVEAIGVGGAIASRHYNVLIHDDLATKNAANSRLLMETAIEWHRASRALMDDPDKSLEFMLGTRWAPGDIWETIAKQDATVESMCRAITEDGQPLWPEMFPQSTIERLRKDEGTLFWLIRMNSATHPDIADFDLTQVRSFSIVGGKLLFSEDTRDLITEAKLQGRPHGPEVSGTTIDHRFRGQRWSPDLYDELKARFEHLTGRVG